MKNLFRFSIVVGLILFGFVLWSIDRERTWEIVSGTNLYLLALGVLLTAPEALSKSFKLRSLARTQSSCSLVDALMVYFVGIPFGAVTPGKAGDFIKVYTLGRRCRIGLPEAFAVGFLDRLLDLVALVLFGGFGVLLLLVSHTGDWIIAWVAAPCVALIACLLLLMEKGFAERMVKPVQALFSLPRFSGRLGEMLKRGFDQFYAGIGLARKSPWALANGLAFALLASAAVSTRTYVFGTALGLNVAWLHFVLLVPLVTLVELLPISILGIGTREYAVIIIFAFLGVDREQAVLLSLSAFVFSITPLAICGYLVAMKEQLSTGKVRSEASS